MPEYTPCAVVAVDAFGCAYEWAEFWTLTARGQEGVIATLWAVFGITPVYLRVVAL